MIHKSIQYAAVSDVTLLEFGHGDIITHTITSTEADEFAFGGVCFSNSAPHPIGAEHPEFKGQTTDEVKPEVIITFTKLESFDVVIERLTLARSQFAEVLAKQAE